MLTPSARFCDTCGAAVPAGQPAAPATEPPSRPALRRRWLMVAVLAALVIGGAGGAAVLLLGGGDGGGPVVPSTPAARPAVSETQVRGVVDRYSAAYSAEDTSELRSLFAPGFKRRNDGEPVEARSEALASYARQFSQLSNPTYTISDLSITAKPSVASASGHYRITSDAGTVTGGIQLRMAVTGGKLLITRIVTTPAEAQAPLEVAPPDVEETPAEPAYSASDHVDNMETWIVLASEPVIPAMTRNAGYDQTTDLENSVAECTAWAGEDGFDCHVALVSDPNEDLYEFDVSTSFDRETGDVALVSASQEILWTSADTGETVAVPVTGSGDGSGDTGLPSHLPGGNPLECDDNSYLGDDDCMD